MFKDWTLKDTKDCLLMVLFIFAILFFVSGFYYFHENNKISKIDSIRYCPQCGFDLIEGK